MKIIDTTTYFEEKLMMEVRFNILDKYVDKFIVSEAKFTHSGKKKNINFNKDDYPEFKKKIIHLIVEEEPTTVDHNIGNRDDYKLRLNSIKRIEKQRNAIGKALKEFSDEDYIIHSDNDEIPNLEKFDLKENRNKIVIFKQKLFYYKFNLILKGIDWFGSKACKIKNLNSISWLRAIKNKKYNKLRLDALFSENKFSNLKIVEDGGWHFSNLKTVEELERKLLNDENHFEYELRKQSINDLKENIESKTITYDHKADKKIKDQNYKKKLENVNIEQIPKFLQENFNKYSNWFDGKS